MSKTIIYVKMIDICKKLERRYWSHASAPVADGIDPKNFG